MNIDKDMLKNFRKDFANAVVSLETKYGIKIEIGSIGYGFDNFHTRLTATQVIDGKVSQASAQHKFYVYAPVYGLTPDMFGKSFREGNRGLILTVAGINPRAPKNPVELQGNDGKLYKCSANHLIFSLQRGEVTHA